MKRLVFLTLLLLISIGFVFSVDYGLLLDQKIEAANNIFSYDAGFTPWFSWNGEKGFSVYLSAYLLANYNKYTGDLSDNSGWKKPVMLPEVTRFSFGYRKDQSYFIEAGRIMFSDALLVNAFGLYDGVRFEKYTDKGDLSTGLFYTGLLYKETAKILMTENDIFDYSQPWGEKRGYLASSRLFSSIRWDMPVFNYSTLSFEVLAQFDLNNTSDKLHSQYGEARLGILTNNNMNISGGLFFETMEAGNEFGAAFGFLADLKMFLPGKQIDAIKFSAKFSSGSWNDYLVAYNPLVSLRQGEIFGETLSGLWLVSAGYEIKILRNLYADAALRYFGRTFTDPVEDGTLYGPEIWANAIWQFFDDCNFSVGGGLFFPALGNAYSDKKVMWKIRAAVSIAL